MKKMLVIYIIILLMTGCNKNEEPIENNEPTKQDQTIVLDDQIVNDLTMTDFNISTDDNNITYIYFDIVNNTDRVINVNKITYTLYEKETEVFSDTKVIADSIEPEDLETVISTVDINLNNVDKVEYIVE